MIPIPTRVAGCKPFSSQTRRVPSGPRIGLVLSGGGSRGLSQIGVLRALEEMGIRPDVIVGTSIGSILGGLYASGYDAHQLERVMTSMDWQELLRLSDEGDRRSLSVEQKPVSDRSIFTLRFDGLQPVLPMSVSVGQRLTNELTALAIQGLYHEDNFDDYPIIFRAVATDLYTGKRIVLDRGSLAEAMRASATVPLVYAPVQRDSLLLVDGGLRSNVPTDVARDLGCEVVIAVNSSSPLRSRSQLGNAVETLDQILTILMSDATAEQLANADIAITPDLGQHLAADFSNVEDLINTGYSATISQQRALRDTILSVLGRKLPLDLDPAERILIIGPEGTEEIGDRHDLYGQILALGPNIASAQLFQRTGSGMKEFSFKTTRYPAIETVTVTGNSLLSADSLREAVRPWIKSPLSPDGLRGLCASVLRVYRDHGYSLAAIREAEADSARGSVVLHVAEGRIGSLAVSGNRRTDEVVILREFPITEGGVFQISDAQRGLSNILGLGLFHHVSFEVDTLSDAAQILIRVVERPSQMLQVGIRADNERFAQIGIELRDANLLGTGSVLSGLFFGGTRNRYFGLQYNSNRLFYTPFSFGTEGYYDLQDYNSYSDVEGLPHQRFEREQSSVYRVTKFGGAIAFGLNVERFGNLFARWRYEKQAVRTISVQRLDAQIVQENQGVSSIELGTVIDTQDKYPYPNKGVLLDVNYRSAQKALGSDLAFSRLDMGYDQFVPLDDELLTLHPRLHFGYGDLTLPISEEFRLGGLHSFYGMRENEFNGRQMFVGSLELRYRLPIKIFFDTYASLRYDVGRTWEQPVEIKFKDLRHGAGLAIGIDTPIGPADFAIGQSFYFLEPSAAAAIKYGPLILYFSIGVRMP